MEQTKTEAIEALQKEVAELKERELQLGRHISSLQDNALSDGQTIKLLREEITNNKIKHDNDVKDLRKLVEENKKEFMQILEDIEREEIAELEDSSDLNRALEPFIGKETED